MERARRWRRCQPGEITALLDLLDRHRGAFEYDWRTRFNLDPAAIGAEMSWGQAWRQVEILSLDSTSQLGAALAGWDYPVDRASLALMDLFDFQREQAWLQGGKKGQRPEPYPRPWPDKVKKTAKPDAEITQEQIVAALRFAGHTAELPAA